MTIWKFDLVGELAIRMPRDAKILDAQKQGGTARLWALVDPEKPVEIRQFRLIGTGHHITDWPLEHIATMQDGPFVWHLFEEKR